MTVRTLQVTYEIDAGDETCGNCHMRTRGWCDAFDDALDYATEPHHDDVRLRCGECLESEVKP